MYKVLSTRYYVWKKVQSIKYKVLSTIKDTKYKVWKKVQSIKYMY
jgi:hypothetical protein